MKITKMKNGNYEFWFSTGRKIPTKKDPSKLKYETIHRSSFTNKKEAEKSYIELKNKYEQGGNDTNQTFGTFVAEWFPLFKRSNTKGQSLAKRTVSTYELILNKHLLPYFGHMNVSSLSAHDVTMFVDQQLVKGVSKQTIKHHYRLLATVVDAIVLRGFLPRNVVKDVRAPQPTKKTKAELNDMVLNLSEQETLLNQVQFELENSDDYFTGFAHTFINLGLSTGLRLSEMLALKWSDIVASTHKQDGKFVYLLKVQRSLDNDGTFKATKSYAGERDIPLSNDLLELLWAHRDWLEEYKQEQFDWVENDLMLPYKDGTPNGDKRVPQQIRNIFDRAGIKGSSHTLRHTCITNWLNSVSNIKLVSTLAGHSAISITLDRYGHVLEENAISEMDNLYSTMRGLDVKKV